MNRRVAIAIPVGLRFADGTAALGLARNICMGGVFVTTSAHLGQHQYADLVMGVVTPLGERTLRISALVIHRHSGGIGLMFNHPDEQAVRILSWLVAAESEQPRRAARLLRRVARLTA